MQVTKDRRRRLIRPDFETYGQSHPKFETEGNSGPTKWTLVQQKFFFKKLLNQQLNVHF